MIAPATIAANLVVHSTSLEQPITARAGSRPPGAGIDLRFASYVALLLRVALGTVFVAHAWLKVTGLTLSGTAAFFEAHGFPGWAAYPVVAVELLGGSALIVGWRTRPVAAVLAGVVLGAGLVAVALLGPGAPALSATRGSPLEAPPGSSSRT